LPFLRLIFFFVKVLLEKMCQSYVLMCQRTFTKITKEI